jgi:hypothetical protein
MSNLCVYSFSISIDGYGAGPRQSRDNPLGVGGMALHVALIVEQPFLLVTHNDFPANNLPGSSPTRSPINQRCNSGRPDRRLYCASLQFRQQVCVNRFSRIEASSSHCMPHVTPRWVSSAGARWKSRDPLECPSTTRPARRGMSPPRPGKRARGDLWAFGMRIVSQPIPRTLSGERVSAITLKNKAKPKRLGKQRHWLTISGVNPLTLSRGSGTPSCGLSAFSLLS